jgi:hypothetical protein
MEETSKQAWEEYKDSEAKAKLQRIILAVLEENKGAALTGREICIKAGQEGLWKRLREMERLGWVGMKERRICSITGKTAYTWTVKG